MPDLDDDLDHDLDDVRYCAIGPGRRRRTNGAIIDMYADGAIDRHCTGCGAKPLDFCRHPNGVERKIPCPQRLSPKVAP